MQLSDYKSHNGTSIQSLADFFLEQAAQAGCRAVLVVFKPEGGRSDSPYSIVTNIKSSSVLGALEVVTMEMRLAKEETKALEPN